MTSIIKKLGNSLTIFPLNAKGCVMSKSMLSILSPQTPIDVIKVNVLKQSARHSILEACGFHEKQLVATLRIVLMHVALEESSSKLKRNEIEGEGFLITKEEVYDFSKWIQDRNPIHLTNTPVVPGLLLLEKIQEQFREASKIQIKYAAPIYADQMIYLKKENSQIQVFSQQRHCLSVNYQ